MGDFVCVYYLKKCFPIATKRSAVKLVANLKIAIYTRYEFYCTNRLLVSMRTPAEIAKPADQSFLIPSCTIIWIWLCFTINKDSTTTVFFFPTLCHFHERLFSKPTRPLTVITAKWSTVEFSNISGNGAGWSLPPKIINFFVSLRTVTGRCNRVRNLKSVILR